MMMEEVWACRECGFELKLKLEIPPVRCPRCDAEGSFEKPKATLNANDKKMLRARGIKAEE
jgi:predicted Zn-ribbon and HTH transcriptional regulator